MGFMIIDGRKVEFTDEKNVLRVLRKAGIEVPQRRPVPKSREMAW